MTTEYFFYDINGSFASPSSAIGIEGSGYDENQGLEQLPSAAATAFGSTVMLAFFVEGLIGTVLIVVALLSKTDLRKSVVNVFVVSLCVNDLCSLLLVVALIIDSYVWRQWRAGDLLCRLNPEFTVSFTGCTLWHTALIAVHRYLVVVHPSIYKRLSKRAYTAFVLVAARVIPFACCLPGLVDLDSSAADPATIGYVPKLLRCVLPSNDRRRIMIVTTVLTIVPCVVVVACYTAVLVCVSAAACRIKNSTMRRELRISAIFGAIFLVVLGGFVPYTVVRSIDRDYRMDADVYVAVSVFYGVATCSSPLVYGALSTQIRQACAELIGDAAEAVGRMWSIVGCSRCVVRGRTADVAVPMTTAGAVTGHTAAADSPVLQCLRSESGDAGVQLAEIVRLQRLGRHSCSNLQTIAVGNDVLTVDMV